MKRRKFLKDTAKAAALPIFLNGIPLTAFSKSAMFNAIDNESDRILVLVELNGGNDGLNTVIPIEHYSKLSALRPNLLIPESKVLKLNDKTGLHPSMSGMKSLYDNAKLKVVQNVGYQNQNRSHFRSTDIWKSGSGASEYLQTGWLGRYFDKKYPGFPEDYPNAECTDPFAITIGSLVSETCQGSSGNFSMALIDPTSLFTLNEGEDGNPNMNTCYGMELGFLREALLQTNSYIQVIKSANDLGKNKVAYPANNSLADQLKLVAKLISGGLKSKVYITGISGFDTHASQVEDNDTTTGTHADLLSQVSEAIAAFQADLASQGNEERVIGMTFSEFGRQIQSNFSSGSDHGTAAPMFMFGPCVNPGILGNNPMIPDQVKNQEGVAMEIDFRSVYGTILKDWFKMSDADISEILFAGWQHLPLIQSCTTATKEVPEDPIAAKLYPNPIHNNGFVEFFAENELVRISILDAIGHEVKIVSNQKFSTAYHKVGFEMQGLPPGNYYLRLETKRSSVTKAFVKI